MSNNSVSTECSSTETSVRSGDHAAVENGCEQQTLSPVADLEPTTKTVPRKSDEPIERGKPSPQTSSQDVE